MTTMIPVRRFRARSSWLVAMLVWVGSLADRAATWWRRSYRGTTAIAVLVVVAACGAAPPVKDPGAAVRISEHRNLGEPAWWWWHQGAPALRLDGRWPTREGLDGPSAPWAPSEARFLRFVEEPDRRELLDRQVRRLTTPPKEIHVRPARARPGDGHR